MTPWTVIWRTPTIGFISWDRFGFALSMLLGVLSLGADLRGGSYLLYEVDIASAQREQLTSIVDDVRDALREAKIGYTGLGVEGDTVVFAIREPDRIEDARKALTKIDQEVAVAIGPDGAGVIRFNESATDPRRHQLVERSIEIIRRRIDPDGIKKVNIQLQGDDRIVIEVQNTESFQEIKERLGQTARLTFRFLDTAVNLEDARSGRLAPSDEILPSATGMAQHGGPPAYVVRKRVVVGGASLIDAQVIFQGGTPAIVFRLSPAGTKRFGDATRQNLGKPLAIVLDRKVISAPTIREPILGGSGVISGSFTTESAQLLAGLLRAGALPAPLNLLEERLR